MKPKKQRKVLARDLVILCDEFDDFHGYCSFLCDAFSCLAETNESLNPDTANGVILYSQWLKRRAGKLREELGRIQKLSRINRSRDRADTDIAD